MNREITNDCETEESTIPIVKILRDDQTCRWLALMHAHEAGLYIHGLHVAKLVTDYSRFCGLAYEKAWTLVEGALLHDVGKIQIPAALLVKPRGFNEAEKQMMILHPDIGAALLEAEGYYSTSVFAIVRSHHERLDGSGYPRGLRKKRTPVAVRVVAVCDAFCAMTENRPYENAWSHERALARLQSMPDQYDGEVVSLLREMLDARAEGCTFVDTKTIDPISVMPRGKKLGQVRPRSAFFTMRHKRPSK